MNLISLKRPFGVLFCIKIPFFNGIYPPILGDILIIPKDHYPSEIDTPFIIGMKPLRIKSTS